MEFERVFPLMLHGADLFNRRTFCSVKPSKLDVDKIRQARPVKNRPWRVERRHDSQRPCLPGSGESPAIQSSFFDSLPSVGSHSSSDSRNAHSPFNTRLLPRAPSRIGGHIEPSTTAQIPPMLAPRVAPNSLHLPSAGRRRAWRQDFPRDATEPDRSLPERKASCVLAL